MFGWLFNTKKQWEKKEGGLFILWLLTWRWQFLSDLNFKKKKNLIFQTNQAKFFQGPFFRVLFIREPFIRECLSEDLLSGDRFYGNFFSRGPFFQGTIFSGAFSINLPLWINQMMIWWWNCFMEGVKNVVTLLQPQPFAIWWHSQRLVFFLFKKKCKLWLTVNYKCITTE